MSGDLRRAFHELTEIPLPPRERWIPGARRSRFASVLVAPVAVAVAVAVAALFFGAQLRDLRQAQVASPSDPTPCAPGDLELSTGWRAERDALEGVLVIGNTSDLTCVLGPPSAVKLLGPAGEDLRLWDQIVPGESSVLLGPGKHVLVDVTWENWCGDPAEVTVLSVSFAGSIGEATVRTALPTGARGRSVGPTCVNSDDLSFLRIGQYRETEVAVASPVPSNAPVVLRHDVGGVGSRLVLMLTADGRAITFDERGADTVRDNAYVERRLTEEGMRLVLDEVLATGAFERDASYFVRALPGVEPPGRGTRVLMFRVDWQGTAAQVTAHGLFSDDAQYYEPSEERSRLTDLSDRLASIDPWLPAAAWADPNARPYQPATYRVFTYPRSDAPLGRRLSVDVADVAWPADAPPSALGTFGSPVPNTPDERCTTVSEGEVIELLGALATAGEPVTYAGEVALVVHLRWAQGPGWLSIALEPILPGETPTCEGAEPPYPDAM